MHPLFRFVAPALGALLTVLTVSADGAEVDPVLGNWAREGGSPLVLGADCTVTGGRHGEWKFTGANADGRHYELHWHPPKNWVDYVALSSDGNTLTGHSRGEPLTLYRLPDAPAAAAPGKSAATSSIVIIRGAQSAGSGFLAQLEGKVYLFTNDHVIAGMQNPRFTLLDGTNLAPVSMESAAGHDLMRFTLKEPPRAFLETVANVDQNAHLNDRVTVLGNSGGGGVVTSLAGTLAGIGPDRIEVTAEIIPGNSGSPILQATTGRVLGIATYLTKRDDEFSQKTKGTPGLRRFGYRLDNVKTWEPVGWNAFQAEAQQIEKISTLTNDIYGYLEALRTKKSPSFATETLRRPAEAWKKTITARKVSDADRKSATQSFLSTLRVMTRADVETAEKTMHCSYFLEKLHQERLERDELYRAFDTESAHLAAPSL